MGTEFQKNTRVDCVDWNSGGSTNRSKGRIESFGENILCFYFYSIRFTHFFVVSYCRRGTRNLSQNQMHGIMRHRLVQNTLKRHQEPMWVDWNLAYDANALSEMKLTMFNLLIFAEKCKGSLRYGYMGCFEVFEFIHVTADLEKTSMFSVDFSNTRHILSYKDVRIDIICSKIKRQK